jgi:hypothetical protein
MRKIVQISSVFCFLVALSIHSSGQSKTQELDLRQAPKFWVDTIQSKYDKFTKKDNFLVYHKTSRWADRNTELPILIQMFKGRLYHYLVFVDPSTHKAQMKLGKRGVGHILTDKFYPTRDGEFYTEFSYVCSKTGYYLLTVFQRGGKKKQLSHVTVLQKERDENRASEFGYK